METIKILLGILIGFGGGAVISGAVFAFIAVIGIVPRLASKTKTTGYIRLYEDALILGGIFGTSTEIIKYYIPIGQPLVILLSFFVGIFIGCLAMSLAEVLNVLPILSRRLRVQKGMFFFVAATAIGKASGSILYFFVKGFHDM